MQNHQSPGITHLWDSVSRCSQTPTIHTPWSSTQAVLPQFGTRAGIRSRCDGARPMEDGRGQEDSDTKIQANGGLDRQEVEPPALMQKCMMCPFGGLHLMHYQQQARFVWRCAGGNHGCPLAWPGYPEMELALGIKLCLQSQQEALERSIGADSPTGAHTATAPHWHRSGPR